MVRCNGVVFTLLPPAIELVARMREDTRGFVTIIIVMIVVRW